VDQGRSASFLIVNVALETKTALRQEINAFSLTAENFV